MPKGRATCGRGSPFSHVFMSAVRLRRLLPRRVGRGAGERRVPGDPIGEGVDRVPVAEVARLRLRAADDLALDEDATPEGPGRATPQADSSDEPAYTSTLTPEATTSIQAAYCNVGEVERRILTHIQEVIYFCVVYGRYLSDGTLVFSNVISVELDIYPYWNAHGDKMKAWTHHSNGVFSGVVSLHRMNGILPPEWMNSVRWDSHSRT